MQALLAVLLTVGVLGLDVAGPVWALALVAVLDAVLGTTLGLFVSAFAETEFQAVQFMPAVVIPQILLCGLFVARDDLPDVLQAVSDVLPLSLRRRRDAAAAAVGDELTGDFARRPARDRWLHRRCGRLGAAT